jgi:3'-phosphoadenosine 5'-phosphosulfate sulfotransferase (PAPS reductase)/FAD synthetase
MDLTTYDVIVVNSSAGKDSLAMLDYICEMAREQGVLDRVTVVHADLGRVEWAGTKELAERQAVAQGVPFVAVKRPQGDLLAHVEERGMWPDSARRYCTSDHKRGQVARVITALCAATGRHVRVTRVLNCMGLRAQESPARAKKVELSRDARLSNGKREVTVWLPLLAWTEAQVWARIRSRGLEYHPAYDLGMPRLSCVFCVFASRSALLIAGRHNRALLDEYVAVEQRIGHTFRKSLPILQIRDAVDAGEQASGKVESWCM